MDASNLVLRAVRVTDAGVIAQHRHPEPEQHRDREVYAAWVADAIARGVYLGFVLEQAGQVVAGAGLTLLEWGPARGSPNPMRARVCNVFTEPAWRRQGLARRLVERCLQEAQVRGLEHLNLSTTEAARGLYEQLGFRTATDEMRRFNP